MNAVMIARFSPGASVVLCNLMLIESEGRECRLGPAARDKDGLPPVIEERFGIPRELVRDALAGIDPTRDVWS